MRMDAMRFREVTSRALERGDRSWMERVAQTPEWLRFRILQVRLRIRRAWTLGPRIRQRGLHFTRDQGVGLVGGSVGAIPVIGLLSATDVQYRATSVLGGAFTAEVSDSGVPYIAID